MDAIEENKPELYQKNELERGKVAGKIVTYWHGRGSVVAAARAHMMPQPRHSSRRADAASLQSANNADIH